MRANACWRETRPDLTRLYLRAGQDEAGLDALEDVVVESGATIVRDEAITAG